MTFDPGRWQDAYVLRGGKTKVHLAGDGDTNTAICGAAVKPWTRPGADSQVCAACLRKAHRPHRDHVVKTGKNNRRRGVAPGPGQTDISTGPVGPEKEKTR